MAESPGKLLGPNLAGRIVRALPWVEAQMGLWSLTKREQPQILGGGGKHLVKLQDALDYDDATGVTGTVWTGKPATATTREVTNIVACEKITTSGTFAADSFVWVERIDGKTFVTGAPCD